MQQNYNELRALKRLWIGLSTLNQYVQSMEAVARERLGVGSRGSKDVHIYGNSPRLEGIPQDLIACVFDWYSVTACTYIRTVGWLANAGDKVKAVEYLKAVMPEVYLWRNKVGVHFALTDPLPEDNLADQAKSVMFPISFDEDAFYAGSLGLTLVSGGEERPKPEGIADWRWRLLGMSGRNRSTSRKDMRWSLTHTHQSLSLRYQSNG